MYRIWKEWRRIHKKEKRKSRDGKKSNVTINASSSMGHG
jgi:hypothetical protein